MGGSLAASSLAKQVLDVQKSIQLKLEESNARYKVATDKKRREKIFKEGDMMMVYLRRERSPAGSYNKLKPKKYSSFRIVKKISNNTYVVDLPSDMAISKTFNVADLNDYYPTEQLYSNDKRTRSFEEGGTNVGIKVQGKTTNRPNNLACRQNPSSGLSPPSGMSTCFSRKSGFYSLLLHCRQHLSVIDNSIVY